VRGGSFGEIELMHSPIPSAATVRLEALPLQKDVATVWRISYSDFMNALHDPFEERMQRYVAMLRRIVLFQPLFKEELRCLAEALVEIVFDCGEDICSQGEIGATCYILIEGRVSIIRDGVEVETRLADIDREDFVVFGEDEVSGKVTRDATIKVASSSATVLALQKDTFELLLGPMQEIATLAKDGRRNAPVINDAYQQLDQGLKMYLGKRFTSADCKVERDDLQLLGQLGKGDFGSIDLAEDANTGTKYALKRIWRCELIDDWHQKQILSERAVLSMADCPFILGLHGTLRDSKALAMLLDLVPGGTLHSLLRKNRLYGEVSFVSFYATGIALAIEHLHSRRILHRDINADNIMLDAGGWPKLSEFFFAKFCVGKTFTITCAPSFMAPEMMLQQGYDFAVDWWSLGVLVYEMLDGLTPFERVGGCKFLDMCRHIQFGIPDVDSWSWPSDFDPYVPHLITSLLHPRPSMRLPMRPNGVQKLKNLQWFSENNISWDRYEQRELKTPKKPPPLKNLLPGSPHQQEWANAGPAVTTWDADF